MINWNKINKKVSVKKIVLPIFLVISIFLCLIYYKIIKKQFCNIQFAKQCTLISEKNANPVFSMEKVYLCSSANGTSRSKSQERNVIDLYQYTDIAVYIDNHNNNGLNNKNTVKQLYIDNIDLELESNGKTSLGYTNLLKFGSKDNKILDNYENFQVIDNEESDKNIVDRIEFNIVKTNEQNQKADYDKPTFYADCSNPISLKYINKLDKQISIEKEDYAVFDGTLLKKAGITAKDLNCRVKFRINIINNENEYYSAWFNFKLPLEDIFQGTSIKSTNTVGKDYNFFTIGTAF